MAPPPASLEHGKGVTVVVLGMAMTTMFLWGFNAAVLAVVVVALARSGIRGRFAGVVVVAVLLAAVVNVAVARDLGAQEERWEQFNDELDEETAPAG